MPDVDLTNRHPAYVRLFERAKLRSWVENAARIAFVSARQQAPLNTAFSHCLHRMFCP